MGVRTRVGLGVLFGAVLLALVPAGCSRKRVPGARGTPSQAVEKFFALRQKGDFKAAAGIIDFPALARRCAGDLWDLGTPADRATLGRAFQVSWERGAAEEREAFMSADVHLEDGRVGATGGRAITRVSVQGAREGWSGVRAIEYTMQRYMGRWRIVGQVFEQQGGQTFDEENLCRPMMRLARERAERARVELTLGHLAQVFLDRLKSGALPSR